MRSKHLVRFLRAHHSWLVAGIVLLAFVLRLPLLSGSLWMDEAAQALESIRPWNQQLQIRDDFQPPLLHLLTHFAIQVSTSEWWLRWWGAVLPALLSIWLLPDLVITLLNPASKPNQKIKIGLVPQLTGYLAALWLATNSFHIFFSQELRPYSLAAWWAVLSWWLILKQRPGWQLALASLAGLYSTYLYPFVLIGQAFYLLVWQRQAIKQHLIAGGLIVAGFLPWLPSFLGQLQAGQQLRTDLPGWDQVVSFSQLKVMPLVAGKFFFGVQELDLNATWLFKTAVLLGLLALVCLQLFRHSFTTNNPQSTELRRQTQAVLRLLISWGIVPLLVAWIVSFWVPVIQPKRVLWLWPLAALFISWLLVQNWQLRQPLARATTTVLAAYWFTLNLVGLTAYYTTPRLQREDWRGLQQQITTQYSPGSAVLVFAFPAPFSSWQWYDQAQFDTISTGYLGSQSLEFTHQQLNRVSEYRFVLVFDYLRTLTDPNDAILTSLESIGFKGVGVIDTPNIGFVRIYARPDSLLGESEPPQEVITRKSLL
jgi:uncharacterized membrane protein